MRALVDPESSLPHLFAPVVNLSVGASVIPDGVETSSGVSSSVYPLTTMVTNYLAPVLTESCLTRWTEDGHSSLVGSVENSTGYCISYSGLPALPDLSSGSSLWASSLGLHLFTNLSSVDAPDPITTGDSCLLHTLHDFVGTSGLTFVRNVPLPSTHTTDCLSPSGCNLMRRHPIHLLLLA